MIDLHAHILPGIDDGPAAAQDALALLEAVRADGVVTIAATPHAREDFPDVRVEEIAGRCRVLIASAARRGVPSPTVVPAAECSVTWALAADEDTLARATYGGRGHDLLVETPAGELPPGFEEALFRIAARGPRLLLAHPERSPTFQREPGRLADLARRGTLLQIEADSLLTRRRGSRRHALARTMLEADLAHVIASDAHTAGPRRPPRLAAARDVAKGIVGSQAEWMVTEAPAAILAGDELPRRPYGRARRRTPRLPRGLRAGQQIA